MKKPLILFAILAFLIVCAVPVGQSLKHSREKDRLATVSARLTEAERQAKQLEAANERLVEERREMRRQMHQQQIESAAAVEVAATAAVSESTVTNIGAPDEKPSSMGGFVAEMMEDPEMRKFIRDQQRQMMDPLYQPLFKQLGLTAEEAGVFKDYLVDTQMKGAEKATALFGGSATDRAKAVAAMTAEQEESKQVIREFLGEEGYAQYEDYQQTLAERAQLNQFRVQNAGSEHPLTDEQMEWLLVLMKEEKQSLAAATGQPMPGAGDDPARMEALLSGEGVEQFLQMQETLNSQVYQRATEGLSPEQMEDFGRFQTNQLQMMRMGMSMARKMFTPEAAE
jgi:hypothetical protein